MVRRRRVAASYHYPRKNICLSCRNDRAPIHLSKEKTANCSSQTNPCTGMFIFQKTYKMNTSYTF